MKLRVTNGSPETRIAHLWLGTQPEESLIFRDGFLTGLDRAVRGHVRLPEGADASVDACQDGDMRMKALHLRASIKGKGETSAFVLIPFLPKLSDAQSARLAALDYAAERARVLGYWQRVVARGTPFDVPEQRFNTFMRGLVARIRISAIKDPKSGLYMLPAASYVYGVYADESVFQIRALDVLGHHELAAEYLDTFTKLQGSKPFAGSYHGDQKGVYHGVKVDGTYDYTTSDYNRDHGVVMQALLRHYRLTGDRDWLAKTSPSLKRAADWIVEQRRLTQVMDGGKRCLEYGLLPAGHLSDNSDWGHWFTVNAYASAGLSELASVLEETGDLDTRRYRIEADTYRQDLREAALRASSAAPVVRLRDNTYVPYVPTLPQQRVRSWGPRLVDYYSRYGAGGPVPPTFRLAADREVLNGAGQFLENNIFAADEPAVRWILDDWEDNATMSETLGINPHGWVDEKYWFSRGGMVFQANLYNPAPTYLRRGEIPAAIRILYNAFVACYYPAVNIFTEEFRQWQAPSGPFYKTPDEAQFVERLREFLVLDAGGQLHLAAGTPRNWLEPGKRILVSDAPTAFGPVSYELTGARDFVAGFVRLPSRARFEKASISVRVPEGRQIAAV